MKSIVKSIFSLLVLMPFMIPATIAQTTIDLTNIDSNIGKQVTICDKITGARYLENSASRLTLLNMGGTYPNQKLTVIILGSDRLNFPQQPELFYTNKQVCVTGILELYEGKVQMKIALPTDILIQGDALTNGGPVMTIKKLNPRIISQQNMPMLMPLDAANSFEIGIGVGTMHGITDVGRPRKKPSLLLPANVPWQSTKLNVSAYANYKFNERLGIRGEITFGAVSGDDKTLYVKGRTLAYRSHIFEVTALGEYYVFNQGKFVPYAMGGLGIFSFNPQRKYNGSIVDLKPLRNEGQGFAEYPDRKPYKLTQLCLPLGAGIMHNLSPKLNIRFEILYRFTTTDYLDDASTFPISTALFDKYLTPQNAAIAKALETRAQRGGSKTEDQYFTMNLKLGIKFRRMIPDYSF